MNLVETMKIRVLEGKSEIPKTPNEWTLSFDGFLSLSKFDFDVDDKLEDLKVSFLTVYKSKAGATDSCYTSRITERVLGSKNKKFSEAYKLVFGVDAISAVIESLVAEGKIRIEGKRTYLLK